MAQTPPPASTSYAIPMPPLQNRAQRNARQSRQSLSSTSFSLGPQQLVQSLQFQPAHEAPSRGAATGHHRDPNASVMAASPRHSNARSLRKKRDLFDAIEAHDKSLLHGHPLTTSTPGHTSADESLYEDNDLTEDLGGAETESWGNVDRMRLWRHDAMMQHLHGSAVFWGDKILSLTGDPNDAFWLAQAHFLNQQYARAEQLLTRPFPIASPEPGNGKGKERATSQSQGANGKSMLLNGPGIGQPDALLPTGEVSVSRLVDMSVACRYLAAQCMVRSGKWNDAIEILGESNPFRGSGRSGPTIPNSDGGIKVEASMCYLRGVLVARLNRQDKAKEHFMEALALDVKCFDAFNELIGGNLMGIDEEWHFVQGLEYMQQVAEDADFVRLVYTIRLKQQKHIPELALARQRLVEEYGMGENPDVLFAFAESMYMQYRWEDCFAITSRIMELVGVHPLALPTHIACMHNLRHLHPRLFLLAHELVDKDPDIPVSWYAVGVYYLITRKFLDARKFFSKANLMDPRFGPAWIGFAHSYSFEGEHDHAIVAYSTAARLMPGTHLPPLFIGMEQLQINNLELAEEYLEAARTICDNDPLLHNERGVLFFHQRKYEEAAVYFEKAIALTEIMQGTDAMWATTYLNLGQSYRKLGRFEEAKAAYSKVVVMNPRHSQGYACLGVINHILGDYGQAIRMYHESLSVDPLDSHTIELLNLALELNADMPPETLGVLGLPGGEELWSQVMLMRKNKGASGLHRGASKDQGIGNAQISHENGIGDTAPGDSSTMDTRM